MKCVHDSEIIFRHVKVTHRKYSRWLWKAPFHSDVNKYRHSYCCYIYSCTKIFLTFRIEQMLFCATFRAGSCVSSFSPQKGNLCRSRKQQANGPLPTSTFCFLPTPSLLQPLPHPHTCQNTPSSSHKAQVSVTAKKWLRKMLIKPHWENKRVFWCFPSPSSLKMIKLPPLPAVFG